ncbi:MAG TPA: DUF3750 domain-containing protein [Methylomirabilota bacterium]|nr:DUF3750 domain-containing protein [Methylomirabilota bacterium]
MRFARRMILAFLLLFVAPIAVSAALWHVGDDGTPWRSRDRGSAGLLADPAVNTDAVVRIFAARTVRWRGIFAVHSWIVVKRAGEVAYTRYDKTGWGDPIRINGFVADGRWFGDAPDVVFAADGAAAEALIPEVEAAVAAYPYRRPGDYRAWPGPNSNTFVAFVIDRIPAIDAMLPSTAVGRDFPTDERWLIATDSGFRIRFGGYAGLALGWRDGVEINILGAVAGLDVSRPGVKLPGVGRLGF